LAEGESVGIFPVECEWFETGNLQDYLQATEGVVALMQAGNPFLRQMQTDLGLGYELVRRQGAVILKHHSAVIETGAVIHGWSVLGAHVKVPDGASLEKVVCADHVQVPSSTPIKNSLLLVNP
jgi:NDP-sugar pyrophosphorylase family protein